jgi:hypothetical protein
MLTVGSGFTISVLLDTAVQVPSVPVTVYPWLDVGETLICCPVWPLGCQLKAIPQQTETVADWPAQMVPEEKERSRNGMLFQFMVTVLVSLQLAVVLVTV